MPSEKKTGICAVVQRQKKKKRPNEIQHTHTLKVAVDKVGISVKSLWSDCPILKLQPKPVEEQGGDSYTNHGTRGAPVKAERILYSEREGEVLLFMRPCRRKRRLACTAPIF